MNSLFWSRFSRIISFIIFTALLFFSYKKNGYHNQLSYNLLAVPPIAIAFPYFLALVTYPFVKRFPEQGIIKSLKSREGIKNIIVLHRKEQRQQINLLARGVHFLPIITVEGDYKAVSEEYLFTLMFHEMGHIRYFHWPMTITMITFLMAIMTPLGIFGYFTTIAIIRQISRYCEYIADRYAAEKVPPEAVITALSAIDNKRSYEWIDYVPILNVLLMTHPPTAFRIRRLQKVNCS